MKVKDLIEKLEEFDEDLDVCFGIPNQRSSKRDDVELTINNIDFNSNVYFSKDGWEYPTYTKNDVVYIFFDDVWEYR